MKRWIPFMTPDPVVAVIRLHGQISTGTRGQLNDVAMAPAIERAFRKGSPKAVALSINSPGGSPVQSSLIAARIKRLSEEKEIPVFAFVEDAAKAYGEKIAVAIDATAGKVVSRGWGTETEMTPVQLAGNVLQMGVQTLICTDVSKDGMMEGPNISLLSEILDAGAKRVIASGGISSMEDLRKIQSLESRGVIGAIVGKAIYEGAIDVKAALALLGE